MPPFNILSLYYVPHTFTYIGIIPIRCCLLLLSRQDGSHLERWLHRGVDDWSTLLVSLSLLCNGICQRILCMLTKSNLNRSTVFGNTHTVLFSPVQTICIWLFSSDSLPFSCSQDTGTKLQISLSFTQWSEPQSNYSSGTVITQSLSMHLITGVLTKNNRSRTPVTQNEIWRGDSEMITACKSSHKIGSYYVSYSNGLFNKTLIACIMLHSSLL